MPVRTLLITFWVWREQLKHLVERIQSDSSTEYFLWADEHIHHASKYGSGFSVVLRIVAMRII